MRTLKVVFTALILSGIVASTASAAYINAEESGAQYYCTRGHGYKICASGDTLTIWVPVLPDKYLAGVGTYCDEMGDCWDYPMLYDESSAAVSVEVIDANNISKYISTPKAVKFNWWGGVTWASVVVPASSTRSLSRNEAWYNFKVRATGPRFDTQSEYDVWIQLNYVPPTCTGDTCGGGGGYGKGLSTGPTTTGRLTTR
ncbi:hypothetical protein A3G63_02975 [Candidatus Kaiserbacteria bacterium RIFCSPLOWO2_12_FULL_52_8]|uniref:Secreted protein n=1 Tax=Candidatus Kaiserbacteria bacterium RIFCSPHIGHO2_01_FULL_53_31 TaxID=1798481 RepID=A0A1F6CJM9_9BACT|nr:MAG: hypothetical protein A2678_01290 [Candidatus Kaiserbacteria bacterium RIFCSPHIGHO2_01_FULL_53_31]OGG94558.1 MAG: hypothetical protein A3G63_02975 [Candidatus Kaiserbacteria bacterium RIFCSPLOWO2_12_FULL_52_8]